nr:hypothetical protein [Tanacetum cinerariifolium]
MAGYGDTCCAKPSVKKSANKPGELPQQTRHRPPSFGVTYTSISSDYEEPSNVGYLGVIIYGYDGLPMNPVDPPSPNYMHGPEEPEQAPLSPDYIPGPEYPERRIWMMSQKMVPRTIQLIEEMIMMIPVDPVPSVEETEPFETDESAAIPPPPPTYRTTARMSIRAQTPISFPSEAVVARIIAIPTPPPSLLTLLLSPLPQIRSPPTHTSPTYAEPPLGFKAVGIRADILEADIPLWKRLCLTALHLGLRWGRVRQPGLGVARTTDYGFVNMVDDAPRRHVPWEVGYGITNIWDELVDVIQEGAPMTLEGVNARVTELAETRERDTQDLNAHLEDAHDSRARLSNIVDILLEDRQFHQFRQLIAALGQIQTLQKMPLIIRTRTRTRTTPTTATSTTLMTDADIRALIAQGVADALVEQIIQRNTNPNDDGSQGSGSDNVKNKAVTGRLKASNNDMHILPQSDSFNQTSPAVHLKHLKAIGRMSKSLSVSRNEPELTLNQLELGAMDVVGYVTNMGRTTQQKTGSTTLDFQLANRRNPHIGLYPIVITVVSVKLYNNRLYFSSTSSSLIIDDEKIHVLRRLKHDDSSGLELTKEVLPGDNTLLKPRTLENLLMWARNSKYDSATFHCDVKIDKIRKKNGWNFPSCEGEKCKKGNISRKGGKFWCDLCDSAIDYPVLRYRLKIKISDDTAEVVVVLFDETTTSLLKCSASAMVASQAQVCVCTPSNLSGSYTDSQLQDEDGNTGLPAALANIVRTSQTLELKSHMYYEHRNYESFTCWKIVTDDVVDGGSNSDIVATKADSKAPEVESLNKNPLLSTLYKPTEENKHRRGKLEDSDAEEYFVAGSQPKGDAVGCSSDTTKKRRKVRKPAALSSAGTEVSYQSLGAPSYQCHNCNATMWYEERNNKGKRIVNPTFSLCCQEGKVLLPWFIETPEPLRRLLDYIEPATSRFRDQIRVYNEGTQPRYAKLWFFDTQNELRNRLNAFVDNETRDSVDGTIVGSLIEMLDRNRAIAQAFRIARDWCHSHSYVNVKPRLLSERTSSRQYSASTVAEVTALITNDFGDGESTRDIIVNTKDGQPKRILELHTSYMALQYPLLFPYGKDRYHDKILYHRNTSTHKTNKGYVTIKEYYAYVIQYRQNQGTTLHKGGRLFQQYLVDAYTAIEGQRLRWTQNNQDTLRVDLYHNVCDAITKGDTNAVGLGKRIVSPHTFIGGLRYMMQNYQDAMARPVHNIHFQPKIDDIISAELPLPTDDPMGYKAITDYMLHGPCGKDARYAPCNVEGKCSKHFPKPIYEETIIKQDGYPIYRRRDNKVTFKKGTFTFDNIYVMPYNHYLLLKYQAHINVEWCNRSKAIKYLFKYLNKGPDKATIVIQENVPNGQADTTEKVTVVDEIKNYLNYRCLTPCEAVWCMLSFDIHYSYPSVMKVNFHLPNQQSITLQDSDNLLALLEREGINVTMFPDWFALNERHPPAKARTYAEIP